MKHIGICEKLSSGASNQTSYIKPSSAPRFRDLKPIRCRVSSSDIEFLHFIVQWDCVCIEDIKHWGLTEHYILSSRGCWPCFGLRATLGVTGAVTRVSGGLIKATPALFSWARMSGWLFQRVVSTVKQRRFGSGGRTSNFRGLGASGMIPLKRLEEYPNKQGLLKVKSLGSMMKNTTTTDFDLEPLAALTQWYHLVCGKRFGMFTMLKMTDMIMVKAYFWTPGRVVLFSFMLIKTSLCWGLMTSAHSRTIFSVEVCRPFQSSKTD